VRHDDELREFGRPKRVGPLRAGPHTPSTGPYNNRPATKAPGTVTVSQFVRQLPAPSIQCARHPPQHEGHELRGQQASGGGPGRIIRLSTYGHSGRSWCVGSLREQANPAVEGLTKVWRRWEGAWRGSGGGGSTPVRTRTRPKTSEIADRCTRASAETQGPVLWPGCSAQRVGNRMRSPQRWIRFFFAFGAKSSFTTVRCSPSIWRASRRDIGW